jgi:hypothetical protein
MLEIMLSAQNLKEELLETYQNCTYLANPLDCESRRLYILSHYKVDSVDELNEMQLARLINMTIGSYLSYLS